MFFDGSSHVHSCSREQRVRHENHPVIEDVTSVHRGILYRREGRYPKRESLRGKRVKFLVSSLRVQVGLEKLYRPVFFPRIRERQQSVTPGRCHLDPVSPVGHVNNRLRTPREFPTLYRVQSSGCNSEPTETDGSSIVRAHDWNTTVPSYPLPASSLGVKIGH